MKQSTSTKIIATVGFSLLGLVFVAFLMVGALFLFPGKSILGAKAVNERDTDVVYHGAELTTAFQSRNIMVESAGCDVKILMTPNGRTEFAGTIGVVESAKGVAFNSFERTLVTWGHALVDDEVYFKIKILEPSGIVFGKKPTTVTINLPITTDGFNFILHNQASAVSFGFANDNNTAADQFNISNLVVQSAKEVTIANRSTLAVGNVLIAADNTKFTCPVATSGAVTVTGKNNKLSFNTIAGKVTVPAGAAGNSFSAKQTQDIEWYGQRGSLTVNGAVQNLLVHSDSTAVSVRTVENGVDMTTETGSLSVNSIMAGGLQFTANQTANVNVSQKLVGNAIVYQYGQGNTNLKGVNGGVHVESTTANGGSINVAFQAGLGWEPSVYIRGRDKAITVDHIQGKTDIQVDQPGASGSASKANITAKFDKVTSDANIIWAGGQPDGPSNVGTVTIVLYNGCNGFQLAVAGAKTIYNNYNNQTITPDGTARSFGAAPCSGNLTVKLLTTFKIQ